MVPLVTGFVIAIDLVFSDANKNLFSTKTPTSNLFIEANPAWLFMADQKSTILILVNPRAAERPPRLSSKMPAWSGLKYKIMGRKNKTKILMNLILIIV
jgi:hypothetical protein